MTPARPALTILFCLILRAGFTAAQDTPTMITIPNGTVGVPYQYDFSPLLVKAIQSCAEIPGCVYVYVFSLTSPSVPGLRLGPGGLFSGTPTSAGKYVITGQAVFSISGPGIDPLSATFPGIVTMTVDPATGPQVSVLPPALSFNLAEGSPTAVQSITVANSGSQSVAFSASSSGANWLRASVSGSIQGFSQIAVAVTANPAGLAPGAYPGTVTLSLTCPGCVAVAIPVVLTVSANQQLLSLSQTGLSVRGISGGPSATQFFSVLSTGTGTIFWTANSSTLSGGPGWLSVSPTSGTSSPSASSAVTVATNPAGLAPGNYYGLIQVSSPAAANSPQSVSIVLSVLPATTALDPDVRPTGLVFVASANGANPAPQTVRITNLATQPLTYLVGSTVDQAKGWLTAQPNSGSVAPGSPASVKVQIDVAGLAPGTYTGQVTTSNSATTAVKRVAVLLQLLPQAGQISLPLSVKEAAPRDAGCNAARLLPVFSLLGQSFTSSAGWPSSLEVTVIDDCGAPMTSGSVVASFSSGDEPVRLSSLQDGRWAGTWVPRNIPAASVTITATAQTIAPPLAGATSIGGGVQANPGVPIISSGGVVNGASFSRSSPLAPGALLSIFGTNLAPGLTASSSYPLPSQLNGTQVLLAGKPIPLYFTSDNQINAVVPYGVSTNVTGQVLVVRGNSYSAPEAAILADVGPAVLRQGSSNAGVVTNTSYVVVDANHPVSAGDTILIFCSGLGAVDPPVSADSAAPLTYTKNPVTVSIGGLPAAVSFAGLAPGFAGLYQVNAVVPSGVTASTSAPLVLMAAGQSSPVTTIAIK